MRFLAAMLTCCFLVACDGSVYREKHQAARMANFQASDSDFNAIAVAAFKLIDPHGAITTLALPAAFDPRARTALKRVAPLVAITQIPASSSEILPAGYFIVQSFTIEDGVATIIGQLGPVTRTLTAANIPDCGRNYSIVFFLEGGDWVNHSYKFDTCAESRHWVPVDADKP